jgi:hypothetical protein
MKTEDLIARLSAEPEGAPAGSLASGVALALAAGLTVTLALFAVLLGPRSDLGAHIGQPVTAAKTLIPLALGLLALVLSLRVARPAETPGPAKWGLGALPLLAAALVLWAFATSLPEARMVLFLGHSIPVCLPAIVLLSAPILAGLVTALRRGAPEHPARLGAFAGLAAAGLATTVYSLFCTEDSPLFYVTWYGLGILIVTGVGAILGARLLRW